LKFKMEKAITRKRNLASFTKSQILASPSKKRKLNPTSPMKAKLPPTRVIVWFRNDLRVSDNYCLQWAKTYAKK